jgi:hydroxyethylthiazole kinase-like uncharacterized protein yjeF
MIELPYNLFRAAQVREMDRIAIEDMGIPGRLLMERAGTAVFQALSERWPVASRLIAVCGLGNNGGDGYVTARLAREAGMAVTVLQVGDLFRVRGDAMQALEDLCAAGVEPQPFDAEAVMDGEVIVDALFGTGLDREVTGPWRMAIEAMNHAGLPVVAVDIPSGLHADTGRILGAATRGALTVTFVGAKQGLFTGDGPDCCGMIAFDGLQIPGDALAAVRPSAFRLTYPGLSRLLQPRHRAAHKGEFGHVVIIGGDFGMSGAVRLAGEAALRVGAGLVTVATRGVHAATVSAGRPELMCHGVEDTAALHRLLSKASVVAIGPGLGQASWGRTMLKGVLETRLPLVVDADALNLLAREPVHRGNWILTPHPGEAGRLLGCSSGQIQADRFAAVAALTGRFGGVCVLKGAGTLIFDNNGAVDICCAGNPGMASGGMGDVLTGVAAGLMAQGMGLEDAARLGVCLHAQAGDDAAREGERGMIAGDLIGQLRALVNPPLP